MIKTIFLSLLLIFSFNTLNARAADSGPPPQVIQKTNPTYAEAKALVKSKKFDKAVVMLEELLKDKKKCQQSRYFKRLCFFVKKLETI